MSAVKLLCASLKPCYPMAAARRTAAVARHMSTESSSAPEPEILHEVRDGLRLLTLNRPKALNALNTNMISEMKKLIDSWERSPEAKVIVLQGTGRAFCAGGDVVSLVKMAQHDDQRAGALDFFKQEYDLDQQLAHLQKPAIALLDGITMGGGVGVSVHLPFRVVTEKTVFSMPETTIGLFPDVGATFFLARMDGFIGRYLGLTSDRLQGYAAYEAGVGTHFVPSGNLDFVRQRLLDLASSSEGEVTFDQIDDVLEENAADASFLREHREKQPPIAGAKRKAIDACFGHDKVEPIIRDLRAIEQGNSPAFKGENLEQWAKETADTIEKRSPTSVKISHEAIRRAQTKTIDQVFETDMQLAATCCTPSVAPDFVTGVTHQLINKQRETRAEWSPKDLASVNQRLVDSFFGDSPAQGVNVPRLQRTRPASSGYTSYPHGGYGLPSERSIRRLITGEELGSGLFARKPEEILQKLRKQYNRASGKLGVKEKLDEVIERMCNKHSDGTLGWRSRKGE